MHCDSTDPADSKSDDLKIIRQVINGNGNAFEVLLKKYKQHVVKIVYRHLPYDQVEETAHEVFIRAYQSLPGFKGKSGFKQWLSGIAVRTCYDFWRKKYRSREISMSSFSEKHKHWFEAVTADLSDQTFHEQSRKKEARELLDRALGRLTPEDRIVLELVYLEGLSGKETADLLGWSVANVKIRSFRSRKKLKKVLTGLRQE